MKRSKLVLSISVALLGSAAIGSTAQAASAVDQSQVTFNTGIPFTFTYTASTNYPLGQSFTAGLNGVLSNIMLETNGGVQGGNNLVALDIHAGDGITGTLLGSEKATVSSIYNSAFGRYEMNIDTKNLGINLQTGSKYTFDITNVSGSGDLAIRGLLASTSNPYANGRIYTGAGYGNQPNWDLAFQTSVVAAVPEPETYGMLLVGLGAISFVARRRKASK